MISSGTRFQNNFKKSIPDDIFYYRFRDTASNFKGGNEYLRFSNSNICDIELFNGYKLYLIELKSTKGKSIPIKNLKRNEKDKRLEDLLLASYHKNVVSCLIIEFSELDRCFFIDISHITDFIRQGIRKSIELDYIASNGIEIEIIKKRVNNSFNIKKLLEQI